MVRLATKPQELVKIHGCLEKQVGRCSRTQPLNMLVFVRDEKSQDLLVQKRGKPFFCL